MGPRCYSPERLNDALQYLHRYGDKLVILAGGTDLLVHYYERYHQLDRVLNIWELEELKKIEIVDGQIEIGSLVTHTQLTESDIILTHAPILAEGASEVGSPQIRNRGTIGGNVANASPAGDITTPLIALDAQVKIVSLDRGEELIPVTDFLTGPGRSILKKDEMIVSFVFPIPSRNCYGSFVKLGLRKALAISTVNTAVTLTFKGRVIKDCRIVMGAVAPTPIRARLSEELIRGREMDGELANQLLKQLEGEISPISDIRSSASYRLKTAGELVIMAIENIFNEGGLTNGRTISD